MLKVLVRQANQKRSKFFEKNKRFTKNNSYVMVQKCVKKSLKQKKKVIEELHTFEKMSVTDSDKESISSSSSEEGKV